MGSEPRFEVREVSICFEYDDANQLIGITQPNAWKSEFVYDGKMRRRITKEYTWLYGIWVPTNEIHYVYDGAITLQERDIMSISKSTYTRGIDLSWSFDGAGGIGGLLAKTDQSGLAYGNVGMSSYFHDDGRANITTIMDASQKVVAKYAYDSFGNNLIAAGDKSNENTMRYSSKEVHQNSGTIYYGYRWYDPSLQRWINRDPIQERGGLNLYTFVYNNPLQLADLFGLDSQPFTREQIERTTNPRHDPTISRQLDLGCIGLCMVYQQSGCQQSMTAPERMPGTTCFSTEADARAFNCPQGKKPFVFGVFGEWSMGKPPDPSPDGRVPNDSIFTGSRHYNYVTTFNTGKWRYAWMDHGIQDGPQTATCSNDVFEHPSYPRYIWCVTCKCP